MLSVAKTGGDFQALGAQHWAFFAEGGASLLVTFENVTALRESEDKLPEHYDLARSHGWSLLTILCEGETWWRDPAVFTYFDRLSEAGFLEAFDHVVLFGAGLAGYAAAAYSLAAPGAELVLVAPRATGDPHRTGWDTRQRGARRIDFDGPYSYAPEMAESAARVWLIHDPQNPLDAMHAALFLRPWVVPLHAPNTGETTEDVLREILALERILEAAMNGRLSPELFAQLWRGRRSNAAYLRSILAHARLTGHPKREAKICRSVTSRLNSPRFALRLAELTGEGQ